MSDDDEMLDLQQVCEFFGGKRAPITRSTVYRWIEQGRLARPIRMGAMDKKWGTTRWKLSDCKAARETMERASAR